MVTAMVAWPRRSLTTLGWTPAFRSRVAQVWRRLWGPRSSGRPASATFFLKTLLKTSGGDGRAVLLGEDEVAAGVVGRAQGQALRGLVLAQLLEHVDRHRSRETVRLLRSVSVVENPSVASMRCGVRRTGRRPASWWISAQPMASRRRSCTLAGAHGADERRANPSPPGRDLKPSPCPRCRGRRRSASRAARCRRRGSRRRRRGWLDHRAEHRPRRHGAPRRRARRRRRTSART